MLDIEKKVSYGQVDSLIEVMRKTGGISDHWNLSLGRSILYKLSQNEYQYLKGLVFGKKMSEINRFFEERNMPRN